jgi:MFS family permease
MTGVIDQLLGGGGGTTVSQTFIKDLQFFKFSLYGFLKNLRFFEPFLILFFLEKGVLFLEIGTLYAIREISTNILEIPTGIVADSLGRRRTMVYSFICYIISFIIFYFSAHYFMFVIAMVLFSFGEAFRTGTHKAMIFEHLKIKGWNDQKVYYYGNTRSWAQVGSAVSSLIAAFIVFYSGSYKFIFLYSTIPYVIDLFLMLTYPKELDGEIKQLEGEKVKQNFKRVVKEFFSSFRNRDVLRAIANSSVYAGFFKGTKDYIQPILKTLALSLPVLFFLEDRQRSSTVIGIAYFLIYMLTSVASKRSGRTAEMFSTLHTPLNITLIVGFLMGILTGIFYNLQWAVLSVILYIGIYVAENLRKPMVLSYVSDVMEQDILATALSAESQASSIVAATTALLIGFFADRYGVGSGLIIVSVIWILTTPLYLARKK